MQSELSSREWLIFCPALYNEKASAPISDTGLRDTNSMSQAGAADVPEPLNEGTLTIFVDGSMRSSPRRGGIGIRFVWIEADGSESPPWDHALPATEGATNQQMELEAPYQALRLAISARAPFDLSDFDKIDPHRLRIREGWCASRHSGLV